MVIQAAPGAKHSTLGSGGLWSRQHLPVTLGGLGVVTLGAYADRATGTVLPSAARQLGGIGLFGAATAAPMVAYVVATVLSGVLVQQRGAGWVLRRACVLFVIASAASAGTPTMPLLVLSRWVSGLSEAGLDVGVAVLLAQALPAGLRPRMFGAMAVAWVLPSVVGPPVSGLLAQTLGWRWAFGLCAALLLPAYVVLRPALPCDDIHPVPWTTGQRTLVFSATGCAVATAALVWAGSLAGGTLLGHPAGWMPLPLLALAGAAVVATAARTLPQGTLWSARGIPTTIALRALTAAAFGMSGAFLPLALTTTRHLRAAEAGVTLTVTGIFWALGSFVQGRDGVQARFGTVAILRTGFAALTIGLVGTVAMALPAVPLVLPIAAWALAGVGIGMVTAALAVVLLDLSPADQQPRHQSASLLASSLAGAVVTALGGAWIAAARADLRPCTFVTLLAVPAVLAVTGLALAGRVVEATRSA